MKLTVFYMALIFVTGWVSRADFYPVFEGKNLAEMELLVSKLEKQNEQNAYLGAVKMKLSGLQKGTNTKLETFKLGRNLLEAEIEKEPENIEWRFLRLAVQEHAPKIVKYRENLVSDKGFIISNFNSAPLELQKIIKTYATKSEILTSSELK